MAIGLFFLLPVTLTSLFGDLLPNAVVFLVVEKLIRIAIFVAYLWAISRLKDLQRLFEYHGAEHKTISCYEAGVALTPENAQRFSRLHPRCGTSFLLIVMIVAVIVFAPLGTPAWYWLLISRVVGIPLVAGLAFEVIKWFGRNRAKRWAQILMLPGMKLQLLTTREPDLGQLAGRDRGPRGGARRRVAARGRRGRPGRDGGRGLVHRPPSPFTLGSVADHRLAASSEPYVPGARGGSCVLASRRQRPPEGKRTYGTMH